MNLKRLEMLAANLAGMVFEDEGRDDEAEQKELAEEISQTIKEWLKEHPAPDEEDEE